MKRDWDLIREQLTTIEEDRDILASLPPEPTLEGKTIEEYERQVEAFRAAEVRIAGHLEMLIDNGYIDGLKITRSGDSRFGFSVAAPRLTMAGHDLLDTMRSPKMWESIKSTAKKKGLELTFDVIKAMGILFLKQHV